MLFKLQAIETWTCMSTHKNYVLLDLDSRKFIIH